jgi:hypothetical protein
MLQFLESLVVEKTQGRLVMCHRARGYLPFLKQLDLVFTNMSRAQAVRWLVESSREIFDCADVEARRIFGVITTLEFFQHHLAKLGHGDLLVTHNLSHPPPTTLELTHAVASAAERLVLTGQPEVNLRHTPLPFTVSQGFPTPADISTV